MRGVFCYYSTAGGSARKLFIYFLNCLVIYLVTTVVSVCYLNRQGRQKSTWTAGAGVVKERPLNKGGTVSPTPTLVALQGTGSEDTRSVRTKTYVGYGSLNGQVSGDSGQDLRP